MITTNKANRYRRAAAILRTFDTCGYHDNPELNPPYVTLRSLLNEEADRLERLASKIELEFGGTKTDPVS